MTQIDSGTSKSFPLKKSGGAVKEDLLSLCLKEIAKENKQGLNPQEEIRKINFLYLKRF